MPGNRDATVFIGNLDERVSDRVLYEILIQAGRVVELHIPRDKDLNRHKGIAFAEYETEEIANYAVGIFSGLVTIYNRTLKFAISGQDKAAPNLAIVNLSLNPNLQSEQISNNEVFQFRSRFSAYPPVPSYVQEPPPPGIIQGNGSSNSTMVTQIQAGQCMLLHTQSFSPDTKLTLLTVTGTLLVSLDLD